MNKRQRNTPTSTQDNWRGLQKLSLLFLKELHAKNPELRREDVLKMLALPNTSLMLDLLNSAGFTSKIEPSPGEILAVAATLMAGATSPEIVARETQVSLEIVNKVIAMKGAGYGTSAFGIGGYGNSREVSKGHALVRRRVTVNGQISYRGNIYSLGRVYGGRTVTLFERKKEIVVNLGDGAPIVLSSRH